ncbi:MAG: cysteine--tRNA ligase [Bacteroidota bacterium]|nr:cysteine--tRNA ligase [Bacteroidota bacterium]
MSVSNQDLKFYNSLTSQKETFKPLNKKKVGMYVCGPTVYNTVHLGNCRTFISFDIIYRYLKHLGYEIRYVRNITDVGHLEENSDEDKVSKRAKIENLEPMEVVQKYTNEFHEIMQKFGLNKPSIEPTASGHIPEQIEMIEEIIRNGHAYEKNGSIYFDLEKFSNDFEYGKLSKRNLDEVINESRKLENVSDKKNPQDFALWKKASNKHIMKWKSPWSSGFPGWHLECSAMSRKYLGDNFDIHGGGIDLKFPHHDCEIAQCESVNNKNHANYWLHTNMLTLNGKKMSKSTNNYILPEEIFNGNNDFFDKSFSPNVVKFFMYQAHYRNQLDISNDALIGSEKALNKIEKALFTIEELKVSESCDFNVDEWIEKCYENLNDDLNTPKLIANIFEVVKFIFEVKKEKLKIDEKSIKQIKSYMNVFLKDILGLTFNKNNGIDSNIDLINLIKEIRNLERDKKNYELSDFIRERLNSLGINIEDNK